MKYNNDLLGSDAELESSPQSGVHHRQPRRQQSKSGRLKRIVLFAIIDLLLIGVGLIVFALFHHAIPEAGTTDALTLPVASAEETEQLDEAVVTPSPTPFVDQGMWGEKFADKFTAGEVIKTDNTYQSEDISVTVTKVEEDSATYYIADIYVRNIENFKTLFAQDTYGTGFSEKTEDMATRTNAIIAVSGDNYGGRNFGVVIRNGVLFRDSLFEDVLIMNNDGSMETFSPEAFDINSVLQNGAWQGWSFGPLLLTDGQPMIKGTFNSSVNPRNPRSAIGYFEPGHYCFILVDGRQPGYSDGLTLEALSQVFYDLGCTVAYNLDGGQTAVMAFMGAETNIPYEGGRKTSDILYIAENEG